MQGFFAEVMGSGALANVAREGAVLSSANLCRPSSFDSTMSKPLVSRNCKAGLKLSSQPFKVLASLLDQPSVVVTREELQKRLWPDKIP